MDFICEAFIDIKRCLYVFGQTLGFLPSKDEKKNNHDFTSLNAGLKTTCCFNVIYINEFVSNTSPLSLTPT